MNNLPDPVTDRDVDESGQVTRLDIFDLELAAGKMVRERLSSSDIADIKIEETNHQSDHDEHSVVEVVAIMQVIVDWGSLT